MRDNANGGKYVVSTCEDAQHRINVVVRMNNNLNSQGKRVLFAK